MTKEKTPLLLIYYKKKDQIPLTEEEQFAWKAYRDKYPSPTGKDIEPEDLDRLELLEQPTGSAATTIPEKQAGSVYNMKGWRPFLYWPLAGCILCGIVLSWFFSDRPAPATTDIIRYDTLVTREGQQKSLKLQDGSMVYLNAASRLRYPTSFTDTDRVVELLGGEISLQVEKDTARPFIVHCQGQQVKVLGTQFNIKAYKNSVDSAITTTLFEGSIQINGDNQQITLKPGQSCVNRQGQLSILVDSLSDVNAWRNSFFTFHNKPLSSIMDEVARWYGVSVRYEHQKQDVPFTITEFNRKDSLKDLLTDLQASRLVRFRMEGKKIVISKF